VDGCKRQAHGVLLAHDHFFHNDCIDNGFGAGEVEGIKRRHLGENAWRELLSRFAQSIESVSVFCRREGLSANTFHRWRARLSVTSEAPRVGALPTKAGDASLPRFVQLGALSAPRAGADRMELKRDLGGGVVLHVARLMFFPEGHICVWLYGEPVDMRKSFDGLYALARNGLKLDPLNGHLFAFVNRRETHTSR